jgi:hypothetical protein
MELLAPVHATCYPVVARLKVLLGGVTGSQVRLGVVEYTSGQVAYDGNVRIGVTVTVILAERRHPPRRAAARPLISAEQEPHGLPSVPPPARSPA